MSKAVVRRVQETDVQRVKEATRLNMLCLLANIVLVAFMGYMYTHGAWVFMF